MEWFLKCVKEHYFDFNGRARRKEYWMFTLVNIIISVALSVVLGLIVKAPADRQSLLARRAAAGPGRHRPASARHQQERLVDADRADPDRRPVPDLPAGHSDAGQNQYGQNPKGIA